MTTMEPEPVSVSHIHVIPVDPSFDSPVEAFKELCIFGRRVTFTGPETWANIECYGGCEGIEWHSSI